MKIFVFLLSKDFLSCHQPLFSNNVILLINCFAEKVLSLFVDKGRIEMTCEELKVLRKETWKEKNS